MRLALLRVMMRVIALSDRAISHHCPKKVPVNLPPE
jgi:hypothetical protein